MHMNLAFMGDAFELIAAPDTDPRLLPVHLAGGDNSRRIRHYKAALGRALRSGCVTPLQQEQLGLFYGKGLKKSEIADRQHRTCSAISKSIRAGQAAIKDYIDMYMDIFDDLEREFLSEEELPLAGREGDYNDGQY